MTRDAADSRGRQFHRLTFTQRAQHILLMAACLLLVITGLPMLFHTGSTGEAAVRLLGGASLRASLHRVGAAMLIGVSVWHVLYVMLSKRAHDDFLRILPRVQDLRDFRQALRMYVGLSPERPRFGHFSYVEKLQYWAVALGCVMMILTGLALWFHDQVMVTASKFWLDVAWVIHGRGAVLGFLAIIVWHSYNVHLRPGAFPMSRVWLTGKISEEQMRADHALEYETMMGATGSDTARGEPASADRQASEGGGPA